MKFWKLMLSALLAGSVVLTCPAALDANQVTGWNETALRHMTTVRMNLLEEERALAIAQIAVYEAANAIQPL